MEKDKIQKVSQIKIEKGIKASELVKKLAEAGFGARDLGNASRILNKMIKDKDCKIFLGLAGAMVPGGMRQIIVDLLEHVDVLVTTGANLTHDMVEALGESHYQCSAEVNDKEMNKKGYDRIHNVFMKNDVYAKLEKFFNENWDKLKDARTIREFLSKLGAICPANSILNTCYQKNIPIFCPALADSGIGLMIWGRMIEGKKINVDAFGDLNDIIDIAWGAKKSGVLYIGGGVPKNFVQQALQFSKGASYGIQITTDQASSGGSSGAPLKEGVSWGKMNPEADFVDVHADATIVLPLLLAGLKD